MTPGSRVSVVFAPGLPLTVRRLFARGERTLPGTLVDAGTVGEVRGADVVRVAVEIRGRVYVVAEGHLEKQ